MTSCGGLLRMVGWFLKRFSIVFRLFFFMKCCLPRADRDMYVFG
jgi:hypothetical protein